jgi:hypothetical protein
MDTSPNASSEFVRSTCVAPIMAGLAVALLWPTSDGFAQAENNDEATIKGYVTAYHPGSGRVFIRRGTQIVDVGKGTPLHAGDVVIVTGNAFVEVRTDDDQDKVTASNSGYIVRSEQPVSPGWFTIFGRYADAVKSLLVKMPPGFAHSESKGGGECAQDEQSSTLRPATALASSEAMLPASAANVSITWAGGVAPYKITIVAPASPRGVTRDGGFHCSNSVDKLDLGNAGAKGSANVTVTDAHQAKIQWTLHFIDDRRFAILVAPDSKGATPDEVTLAALALTSDDPRLHLAGMTMLTSLASTHFVAWRLAEAVKSDESY